MISIIGANGVLARALSDRLKENGHDSQKVTRHTKEGCISFSDFLSNLHKEKTTHTVYHLAGRTRLNTDGELAEMIEANLQVTLKLLEVVNQFQNVRVISIVSASSVDFKSSSPKFHYQLTKYLEYQLIKESKAFSEGRWLLVHSPLVTGHNKHSEILNSIAQSMDLGSHFLARNPGELLNFIDEKTLSGEIICLTAPNVLWPKKYEIEIQHWRSSVQIFSDNCEFFFNKSITIEEMEALFLSNTESLHGFNSEVTLNPIQQIESVIENLKAIRNF